MPRNPGNLEKRKKDEKGQADIYSDLSECLLKTNGLASADKCIFLTFKQPIIYCQLLSDEFQGLRLFISVMSIKYTLQNIPFQC